MNLKKIEITAYFSDEQELAVLLREVIRKVKQGYNTDKKTFSKWQVRSEDLDENKPFTVLEFQDAKVESKNGEDFILIESKLNYGHD